MAEDVAIATVVGVSGSVPREVGAKMLIKANGDIFGTIGGGAGEAKVIRYAVEMLQPTCRSASHDQKSRKGWVEIDLTGNPHRDTEGVCGGTMRVWVECWSDVWGSTIVQTILHHLQTGTSITLTIPFTTDSYPALTYGVPEPGGIGDRHYAECLLPPPTLLIVGAGHVGIALATAAEFIGFRIVVQDDRLDVWRPGRFSAQTQCLKGAIAPALEAFQWPDNLYVALVTRGAICDLNALRLILSHTAKRPPCYIGMIGSQKRIRHVFRELESQGVEGDRLTSIHAPIGIDIGALTPEEIAISICAELIQIRRTG